jgi:DNA polymerase III epsilon subunit-like protein
MKIFLSREKGHIDAPSITFFDFEATTKEPSNSEILNGYFKTIDADSRSLVEDLHVRMRPNKYIASSYEIHGISEEEAKTYPDKKVMMREIFRYLIRNIDSLFICHANWQTFGVKGYFDWQLLKTECLYMDILNHFNERFSKCVVYSTHTMAKDRKLPVDNYRLGTLSNFIGYEFNAHVAESDVNATEALFWWLVDNNLNLFDIMEGECQNTEYK